jgi:hypothetical protein
MKKNVALLFILAVMLSGCELASGIFKAGFWSGILIVVAIIGIIIYIVGKAGKK